MNKGIYNDGKVFFRTQKNEILREGKINIYEALNTYEWWVVPCQEVYFEVVNNKAYIKQLGDKKTPEFAEKYCN